jgi:hypothetical protein
MIRQKNSPALTSYENLTGTITINGTTYTIISGWGIYNLRSLLVELHAVVQNGNMQDLLILHGHTDSAQTGPGSVPVHFLCPQSKLAAMWFLQLDGTLKLASSSSA